MRLAPQRIARLATAGPAAATTVRPAKGRVRSALQALFASCPHDGPMTPLTTLCGAEVWRCERCGSPVLFADELTPEPSPAGSAGDRSSRKPG